MNTAFAQRVFFWSGVWGVLVLVPHLFMEDLIGRVQPPAITHPETFYGFLVVALAWQWLYIAISHDVVRYQPLMPVAAAGKLGFVLAIGLLYLAGRLPIEAAAPALIDLVIGMLFLVAHRRTGTTAADRHELRPS